MFDEQKISNAIKDSGIDSRELARKMGVSVSSAESYRFGVRRPRDVAKLARILGIELDELKRDEAAA